jgi:hypothetical protein
MKMIYEQTNEAVKVGDIAKTFRGETVTVTGFEQPRHSGSTGRVYVKFEGFEETREFFPGVIGARWIESGDTSAAV